MSWTATRIVGPLLPNSSATHTVYTPSTGATIVVKEVILGNNSTNGGTMRLGIGGVGSSQLIVPETYLVAKSTTAAVNNLTILALATVLSSTADILVAQNGASSGLLTLEISAEVGP